jgi:hypothetical protein
MGFEGRFEELKSKIKFTTVEMKRKGRMYLDEIYDETMIELSQLKEEMQKKIGCGFRCYPMSNMCGVAGLLCAECRHNQELIKKIDEIKR